MSSSPAQIVTREPSSDHSLYEPARRPMRVFVFLAHGFGARGWTARWTRGEIPGLNEKLPYGYYHAANGNCFVEYSEDAGENRLTEFARRSLRRLLGFDLIHAWRNRKALFAVDVVWAHTELEHLAVLALWQFRRRPRRPRIIAQSVWLFDRWHQLHSPKRWLYRRLMTQADVLAAQSPENLEAARALFPQARHELIGFAVNLDSMVPPVQHAVRSPVRIAALGNDMHRDWETLITAAGNWSGCRLRIASRRPIPKRLAKRAANVEVMAANSTAAVAELYSWADLVVVPLKPNLHASGITVICEAILRGVPVISTDTGGLRAYFSGDELRYVPPRDPAAMRRALEELADDDELRCAIARRAQARILSADFSSRAYAMRHYELSQQLLADRLAPALDAGLSDPTPEPAWQPSSQTTP